MGVSTGDLTRITLDNNHTAYKHICLQGAVCVKNYPPEIMQPSSSTRATIVSAENQNGATIVKASFFFCHYYIVWESNNAWRSTRKILKWKSKIQMNPRRIVRLYEWYKAKTFCCAFFAAAMLTMVAAATIVRPPSVIHISITHVHTIFHWYNSFW